MLPQPEVQLRSSLESPIFLPNFRLIGRPDSTCLPIAAQITKPGLKKSGKRELNACLIVHILNLIDRKPNTFYTSDFLVRF